MIFKQICIVTANCAHASSPDSNSYTYTHDRWTFFTTNYDNAIEDFWVNGRGYSSLYLGFEPKRGKKVMQADRFLDNNTGRAHTTAMQLVKLHESVNWIQNRDREIEEQRYHLSLDDVKSRSGSMDIQGDILIYPLSQKHLYFTPFTQLFGILNAELRKRDFWVIIGYSFRDIIIRTMFERSLAETNKRKIILVHPHATDQIKPLFQNQIREQLTCLDRYFARRNYISVNKEIAEVLLSLANA